MKLVLFDLDGTLVDAGPCGAASLNAVMRRLYGVKPAYDINALAGKTDSNNFSYVYKAALKKNLCAARLKAMKKEYLGLLKEEIGAKVKNKKYKEVAGAGALLKIIAGTKNIRLGLATGNFEEAARIKLTPLGFDKFFAAGGFGGKVKDRVSLISLAVSNCEKVFKTKFRPDDIFVIGDTHIDITAAKELGLRAGAVTGASLGDMNKLLRAAAEIQCKDFKDLDLWLMWLGVKADPKGVEKGSYIMPASAIEHVFFSRTGIDEQRLKMFKVKKYSDLESGKLI